MELSPHSTNQHNKARYSCQCHVNLPFLSRQWWNFRVPLTVLSRGPTQHGEGQLAAAEPHSVLHLAVVKLGRQTDPAVNIFTHNQTMLRCYRQLASSDFRLQLYFSFSHVDEKYYNPVSVLVAVSNSSQSTNSFEFSFTFVIIVNNFSYF